MRVHGRKLEQSAGKEKRKSKKRERNQRRLLDYRDRLGLSSIPLTQASDPIEPKMKFVPAFEQIRVTTFFTDSKSLSFTDSKARLETYKVTRTRESVVLKILLVRKAVRSTRLKPDRSEFRAFRVLGRGICFVAVTSTHRPKEERKGDLAASKNAV